MLVTRLTTFKECRFLSAPLGISRQGHLNQRILDQEAEFWVFWKVLEMPELRTSVFSTHHILPLTVRGK